MAGIWLLRALLVSCLAQAHAVLHFRRNVSHYRTETSDRKSSRSMASHSFALEENVATDADNVYSIVVVTPKSLPAALRGQEVHFDLPDGGQLVCILEHITEHPETRSRTYMGHIDSLDTPAGSCVLSCGHAFFHSGFLNCVGNLRPDNQPLHQYELRSKDNGNIHTLTKVSLQGYITKTDAASHSDHAVETANGTQQSQGLRGSESSKGIDTNRILDLMIVYTQLAEDHLGSMEAIKLYVNHAIDEANGILGRSEINMRIRAVHVGKMQNTLYVDPNDLGTILDQATNSGGAYSAFDYEQILRYTLQADALVVVARPASPALCGKAWINSAPFPAYYMVSVVDLTCMVGYYAFIHELGHNLGAAHDRSVSAPNEGAYRYSHGWCWDVASATSCDGTCRRSLMSYSSCTSNKFSCTSCKPYPYFSNPNVFESGSSTGSTGADNARTIDSVVSYATGVQDSRQTGGMIFSINPNHIPVDIDCFEVNITGWSIGDGADITRIVISGVESSDIIDQGPDFVQFRCNSSLAVSGTGDVTISRLTGENTTIANAFTFHPVEDLYHLVEDFESGDSPFYLSGAGAFYYFDGACPTGSGQVCESFGPAYGDGMFVMVRPDSGGRVASVTADFSSSFNCQDTIASISVKYYAFSDYPACYEADFLTIEVKYTLAGPWVVVATATEIQVNNTASWLDLDTQNEPFHPAVLYGVRIQANSFSPTPSCSYWNPVALDNINIEYSTICSSACYSNAIVGGASGDSVWTEYLFVAAGVGAAVLGAVILIGLGCKHYRRMKSATRRVVVTPSPP